MVKEVERGAVPAVLGRVPAPADVATQQAVALVPCDRVPGGVVKGDARVAWRVGVDVFEPEPTRVTPELAVHTTIGAAADAAYQLVVVAGADVGVRQGGDRAGSQEGGG